MMKLNNKYHLTRRPAALVTGAFAAGRLLLLALLTLLPMQSIAQPAGYAGSFSRIGFGPRGIAMGNAILATTEEGIYAYYNPAHAAYAQSGNQVDLSASLMSFDRSLNSLNATFSLPPSAGLTISLLNANVEGIDGRTSSGYFTGDLQTSEYQLMSSFGINVSPKLAIGLGVKFNLADYHPKVSPAKGVGFDIGALYKASGKLSLGVSAQDLLAAYSWSSAELYNEEALGESTEHFPSRFNLGASYRFQSMLAASSIGLLVHEGEQLKQLKVGLSWQAHERITLRGGWQINDLGNTVDTHRPGAGFSIHLPFDILKPSVDYAYLKEPVGVSSMHVFGLRMNL
jgi:hypothetical protein